MKQPPSKRRKLLHDGYLAHHFSNGRILPDHVMLYLFAFLSPVEHIRSLRRVCQLWRKWLQGDVASIRFITNEYTHFTLNDCDSGTRDRMTFLALDIYLRAFTVSKKWRELNLAHSKHLGIDELDLLLNSGYSRRCNVLPERVTVAQFLQSFHSLNLYQSKICADYRFGTLISGVLNTKLSKLVLYHCNLDTVDFRNLPNLKTLRIRKSTARTLLVSHFNSLKVLDIGYTNLELSKFISSDSNAIEALYMNGSTFSENVKYLCDCNLKKLRKLSLEDYRFTSDLSVGQLLASCPNLKSLNLSTFFKTGPFVSSEVFSYMGAIEELTIQNNLVITSESPSLVLARLLANETLMSHIRILNCKGFKQQEAHEISFWSPLLKKARKLTHFYFDGGEYTRDDLKYCQQQQQKERIVLWQNMSDPTHVFPVQ